MTIPEFHSLTLGRIACEAFRGCLPATLGRHQRSRNRCSGWLQRQAGVSNRLPVNKNLQLPGFLKPFVPFRRGGGGDRRRQAGLTSFREISGFSTSNGIGIGKRNIGATLDWLVGGVQCGQWSQQQGGEGVKGAF